MNRVSDDYINIKREYEKYKKEFERESKLGYCLICKKKMSKYCNSHSVPRFILANIAENGMLANSSIFNNALAPLEKNIKGVNNTGTFYRICNSCDSIYFAEYESDKYLKNINSRSLTAIALKTVLFEVSKKLWERESYIELEKKNLHNPYSLHGDLDRKEYIEELNRLIKAIKGKKNISYEVIYYRELNYVVPIACQRSIALFGDLKGYIINDLFNTNPRYKTESLYLCVFPLKQSSIILLFCDKKSLRYHNFILQFNKLSDMDKLELINYLIFKYTEDYYINPTIAENLRNNKSLIFTCMDLHMDLCADYDSINECRKSRFEELMDRDKIPNLLTIDTSH